MTQGAAPGTPLELPLDRSGTVLVEASAGTGKTHALTTLIARLVVEEGREIDEILVVTFTRAATAELRDRIRRTLKAARCAVEEGDAVSDVFRGSAGCAGNAGRCAVKKSAVSDDPQAQELYARWAGPAGVDLAQAARRLRAAIHDIDRASVCTIHAFCQRVLGDLAFEGAFPFGFEVSGDDSEVTAGAVRDFWRRRLYDASPVLVGHAVDEGFLPDALAEWAAGGRTKPGLHIVGGEAPATPPGAREAEWRAAFETVRARWETHGAAFRTEMREGGWLNRSKYHRAKVEERLALVERALAAPEPRLWEAGVAGWFGTEMLTLACKKRAALPENRLFDAFDALEEASGRLREAFDAWLRWARAEMLAEVRGAARRRAREDRRLRYDDLLIEVEAALGREGGVRLARSLRRAHPCALIDEYQDTDQVQARIFARVYGETGVSAGSDAGGAVSLFVVGDPKQSIYRFRGADIFAYLDTRRLAREVLPLDRNWRSVPGLVEAVNAVFAAPLPFAMPEIAYRAVDAAPDGEGPLRIAGEEESRPFALRLLPAGPDGKPWNKGDAYPVAAEAAAKEVARLLGPGAAGTTGTETARHGAALDGEPLRGSHIAVLVPTRSQGQLVARALRECGVRAAEVGDNSVFDTREAEHLERLLRCLAEPVPERELRGALAGDLFALDTPALHAMDEDDEVWSGWRERLRAWRNDWETRGVGAFLLRLLEHEGGAGRLLRHRDGTRRLTNYRHLAELLLDAETGERLSPSGLAAWLGRRRQAGERGRDESALLRLDSDEQLVRILTVHGAKGLEFPVVFCPFAWHAPDPKGGAAAPDVVYHERAGGGYREVLDLMPDEAARRAAVLEEFSESIRLLYVALTRAKYRCVVTWGHVKGAARSPLAWLLHRDPVRRAVADGEPGPAAATREGVVDALDALDALAGRFNDLDWHQWRKEVEELAARCPEGVSVDVLDPDEPPPPRPAEPRPPALAARDPVRALRRVRQMTSFSALSAESARAAGVAAHALVEGPDHDARDAPPPRRGGDEDGEGALGDEDPRSAFTFPRGATAGSCLHRIFERLDQAAPGDPVPDLDAVCRDALLELGFEVEWRPVVRSMVERTRALRLHAPEGRGRGGPAPRVRGAGDLVPERAGDLAPAPGMRGAAPEGTWIPSPDRGRGQASAGRTLVPGMRSAAPRETPGADRAGEHGTDETASSEQGRVERSSGAGTHDARDDSPATRATGETGAAESGTGDPPPRSAGTAGTGKGDPPPGSEYSDEAEGFRLADPVRRIAEMEFHFPVSDLTRHRLAACLTEHGYPDPFGDGAGSVEAGDPPPIEGFLRGFIDLTVEHEGRWYLLDYKSNWLGPAAADYAPAALTRATHANGYPLQYLIYLVALHRHLRARLAGYDYERHIGGVFYLYLRGIDPAAGMRRGVYFDRPPRACIEALDACFRGGGAR